MIPFIPDENSNVKPIFVTDEIGICQKCEGEEFDVVDEYDIEGEKYLGALWTCQRCGQRYREEVAF